MVTFIHTADWQLGKPFSRVCDDEKRSLLRRERIEAIRRIGTLVRAKNAAFVVVAGDVFDSNTPSNETVSAACDAIRSIGVPVYVIPGNHDHAGPGSIWEQSFFIAESRERAANLHVLLDAAPVEAADSLLLPCPLIRQKSMEDPTAWIRDFDFGGLDAQPRIVIAHGSTLDFQQAGDEEDHGRQANHIELAKLPMHELDYLALGDWHGMVQAGQKAWYSGSHETDRYPKKGQTTGHVAVVQAGRGTEPVVQQERTGRTQWLDHTETFASDAGPATLREALDDLVGAAERGLCLLRLTLGGSLGLAGHSDLSELLTSWQAGLLDLRLLKDVSVAPTVDEIDALTRAIGHPLIAQVAGELKTQMNQGGPDAAVAGTAIALLHEFVRAGDAR